MTRTRKAGATLGLLSFAAFATPVQAGDYFFSEGGYEVTLDEPTRASDIDFQPIGLTAGQEYFDDVDIEDILLRCVVFTGRKGVKVTLEGDIAEGDDFEPTGSFPPVTKKTKKNGYAEFELDFFDLDPLPATDVEPPLLVALEVELRGNQELDEASLDCTLGVPLNVCDPDDTTLCLQDDRFRVEMFWVDPFDGTDREAVVLSSTPNSGIFFFPPFDPVTNRRVAVVDNCGPGLPFRAFQFETSAQTDLVTSVVVTDTETGLVRRYPQQPSLDSRAFETCP
jgi:hypothetical protein